MFGTSVGETKNTLLGFTALFTHHNHSPHFEEVGEIHSESDLLKATPHIKPHFQFSSFMATLVARGYLARTLLGVIFFLRSLYSKFSSVQFSSVQFSSVQFSSVQFSSVQFSSVGETDMLVGDTGRTWITQ